MNHRILLYSGFGNVQQRNSFLFVFEEEKTMNDFNEEKLNGRK